MILNCLEYLIKKQKPSMSLKISVQIFQVNLFGAVQTDSLENALISYNKMTGIVLIGFCQNCIPIAHIDILSSLYPMLCQHVPEDSEMRLILYPHPCRQTEHSFCKVHKSHFQYQGFT